jgi:hypothetical protein
MMAVHNERSPLRNIVLNVHGFAGGLRIGGLTHTATLKDDLGAFGLLRPMNVGTIWIVSCSVAKDTTGKAFCQTLARTAGTVVIASDTSQRITTMQGVGLALGGPWNIDDFEGNVFAFYPNGGVSGGTDPTQFVWTVKVQREKRPRVGHFSGLFSTRDANIANQRCTTTPHARPRTAATS